MEAGSLFSDIDLFIKYVVIETDFKLEVLFLTRI